MSGLQGALGAIQAIGNVGGLFGGTGSVTLGSVTLQSMEVPERITIGGPYALKVFKYPGGARSIDAMGTDDAPMSWSGIMLGPNAEQRMQLLYALRNSGQVQILSFGTMSYQVVVSDFKGDYLRTNYCLYQITCEVLADNARSATNPSSTLNNLVGSDIGSSISSVTGAVQQASQDISAITSVAQNTLGTIVSTIGPVAAVFGVDIAGKLQGVANALNEAQGVAGGLSAISNAPSVIAGTITSMQSAGTQVLSTLSTAETAMAGVVTSAPSGSIFSNIGDMFTSLTASSTIASMTTTAGYLNRSGSNLALNAPSPNSTGIIAAAGSPLAQELDSNSGAFSAAGYNFGPETIVPLSQAQ
jgi:hypothetical protein